MKQTDIDRFIRKIQMRSRITTEDRVIRLEPVQDSLVFDMKPSKYSYSGCSVPFCVDFPNLSIRRVSA